MKRIVLVYGGSSTESEISILTALKTYKELIKVNKNVSLVYLDHDGNFYTGKELVNLESYSLKKNFKIVNFKKKNNKSYYTYHFKKVYFDLVLILGHGKNVEDGTLSSYFEILKIPYLYDDLSNVSLFQDKIKTKLLLKNFGINQTKFTYLHKHQYENYDYDKLELNYPLITKPSRLGSSIGIKKVNNLKELKEGLIRGFMYDETVLIEEFIDNKIEYNIAILGYQDKIIVSDIEEVNQNNQVLSFYDKYDYSKGNEKRIIKPKIVSSIKDEIIETSRLVFNECNLCGLYRFDFIFDIESNKLYLNEINTLPGSLAYYLFESKGIKMVDLILMYIEVLSLKNKNRSHLLTTFQEGFVSNVDLDKLKK